MVKGRIKQISQDDRFTFRGVISAEDGTEYMFNSRNWAKRNLNVEDIHEGDEVEFEKKEPNKNGNVYPNWIRFAGESAPPMSTFAPKHCQGDFKGFVFIDTRALLPPLKNLVGEAFGQENENPKKLYRVLAIHYNQLEDKDFVYSTEKETVQFPSGFTSKEGHSIDLYCVKNRETGTEKSTWYCNKLICNGEMNDEGILHGLVNADWYEIRSGLMENVKDVKDDVNTVVHTIETRCFETGLIWLKEGMECTQDDADHLFVPTGYYLEDNRELYLYCTYHGGKKGRGWYYDGFTYKDAPLTVYDKKLWLKIWAGIKSADWKNICEDVANKALVEKWTFGREGDYGILSNYLVYTFAHEWNENKIYFSSDERYAVFNTGLADRQRYKYIYALFKKVENDSQTPKHFLYIPSQYQLSSFTISGIGGDGKILTDKFESLPNPPKYFDKRSSTVWELEFDSNNGITIPEYDDTHILIQRCERLPLEFLRRNVYNESLKNILDEKKDEEQQYKDFREFFAPILNNTANEELNKTYRELNNALKGVIENAVKRLSWNWRAVVPSYHPETDESCFLLPVSFLGTAKPDRAMIATAGKGGVKYQIHTVISLEWAYLDARLVCRPESEWLAIDSIDSQSGDENEKA